MFDQHYGVPLAKRFHYSKPPTILDAPASMQWAAVDIPDPETPVGSRGVGEAPVGSGFGAIVNAISDALGDEVFKRAPVTPDLILMALEAGRPALLELRIDPDAISPRTTISALRGGKQ